MIRSGIARYKMIFCDIDGTLIDSSYQIPNGTKQKIRALDRGQIPFILVSARMPSGIFPLQRELGIKAPVICYSGALILSAAGECLQSTGIERETAIHLDAYLKQAWSGISCNAFCGDNWIVTDPLDAWVMQEQRITSSVPVAGTIPEFVPPGGQVHKFLCMGDAGEIADLNRVLKEKFPALSVYRSKDTYLEIMDGAATKSGAIRYLCKDYGISTEETVSFGDNFNDVDMLLATGTSFAMGNAPEEVKRQAKNVTLDNDHEGVLAGLMQINFAENRI